MTPVKQNERPVSGDLFTLDRALTPAERKRLRGGTQPKGYAAPPGSGPAGETCGSCDHLARVQPSNRSFPKCGLMERGWTGGTGSDVRVRAAACSRWSPPTIKPRPDAADDATGGGATDPSLSTDLTPTMER